MQNLNINEEIKNLYNKSKRDKTKEKEIIGKLISCEINQFETFFDSIVTNEHHHINFALLFSRIGSGGALEKFEILINSPLLLKKDNKKKIIHEALKGCAYNGKLDFLQYMLTNKKMPIKIDIHHDNDYVLRLAAFNGHLDIVKYVLTSSELKEHADIHAENDEVFRYANDNANFESNEIIKFLLDSAELKENVNPNAIGKISQCVGFMSACFNANLEMMEYIYNHPKTDKNLILYKVNADSQSTFELACENDKKDLDVVMFLINHCNIEPDEHITQYMNRNPANEGVQFFINYLEIKKRYEEMSDTLNRININREPIKDKKRKKV